MAPQKRRGNKNGIYIDDDDKEDWSNDTLDRSTEDATTHVSNGGPIGDDDSDSGEPTRPRSEAPLEELMPTTRPKGAPLSCLCVLPDPY